MSFMKTISKDRIIFTAGVFTFVSLVLAGEYFSGGVVTHHLLASADMPGISNGWGLVLLPAIAWLLYPFMPRNHDVKTPHVISLIARYRIAGAVVYGGMLGASWEIGSVQVPSLMMMLMLIFGIVYPLYRAEIFLGVVIGMTYTFGVALPIIAMSVVAFASFVTHNLARLVIGKIRALNY